jgi:dUTPase
MQNRSDKIMSVVFQKFQKYTLKENQSRSNAIEFGDGATGNIRYRKVSFWR